MTIKINVKFLGLLKFLIVFLIIINSGYALTTGMNKILFLSQIVLFILLLFSQGKIVRLRRNNIEIAIALIMLFSMVTTFLINMDFSSVLTYIQGMLYIVIAYMVSALFDSDKVIFNFLKVMRIIAAISIAFSLLNLIIPISAYAPVITNGAGVKYYTLIFVHYIQNTYGIFTRCCGIFWEPGLFAGFLSLSALLDLYTFSDPKIKWRIFLYCIAIYFTYSTAGYIYILMIILLVISKQTKRLGSMFIVTALIVCTIFVWANFQNFLELLVEYNPNVWSKILSKNDSYLTRTMPPLADLKLILQNPFGVGYGNIQRERVYILQKMGINVSLSTSTLTYHGASCGLLFFVVYNFLWIRNIWFINKTWIFKLTMCILFVMILSSSPMYNNQFIWILLFNSWKPSVKVRSCS